MQHQAIRLSVALATFLFGITAANLFNGYLRDAPDEAAEREVWRVEQEYVRAHLERDVSALDRVLADDFSSFRGRIRKEHRMALLANPLFKIVSLKTEGVRVEVNGDEARVTGKARLKGESWGREFESPRYQYTRRLAKRDGRWQIVHMRFATGW